VEAPLPQPPYSAVLRFLDDGTEPLTEQGRRRGLGYRDVATLGMGAEPATLHL
jgi:hypothetical protein